MWHHKTMALSFSEKMRSGCTRQAAGLSAWLTQPCTVQRAVQWRADKTSNSSIQQQSAPIRLHYRSFPGWKEACKERPGHSNNCRRDLKRKRGFWCGSEASSRGPASVSCCKPATCSSAWRRFITLDEWRRTESHLKVIFVQIRGKTRQPTFYFNLSSSSLDRVRDQEARCLSEGVFLL